MSLLAGKHLTPNTESKDRSQFILVKGSLFQRGSKVFLGGEWRTHEEIGKESSWIPLKLNFTLGSQIPLPPAKIKWQLHRQKSLTHDSCQLYWLLCSITKILKTKFWQVVQQNLLAMYLLKMIVMLVTFFPIFHLHTLVQGKQYVAHLQTSSHCALKPVFK